jgi:hypothetical protein
MEFPFTSKAFSVVNGKMLHYRLDGSGSGAPRIFINSLGSDYRIWDALPGD